MNEKNPVATPHIANLKVCKPTKIRNIENGDKPYGEVILTIFSNYLDKEHWRVHQRIII